LEANRSHHTISATGRSSTFCHSGKIRLSDVGAQISDRPGGG
jgi:hypothetical protein